MESATDSGEKSKEIKKMNEEAKKLNTENEKIEIKQEYNDFQLCKKILEWVLKYLVSLVLGFCFGYAMEKAKVHEPKAIRQQMIFQLFIMLKMFLAAFGTSTLSILLVALLFKKR